MTDKQKRDTAVALLDAVRQERMGWELEATVQRVCQHGDEMAVVRHFIASNIAKGIKIAEDIIAANDRLQRPGAAGGNDGN